MEIDLVGCRLSLDSHPGFTRVSYRTDNFAQTFNPINALRLHIVRALEMCPNPPSNTGTGTSGKA
jgi:hypothetical protein